jgi:hypothetical protein
VVNSLPENEFEAEFALAALPNGPLSFECSAADTGEMPVTGTATVNTFLDLGPTVRILEPADASSHALQNPVLIKFEVAPNPVSENDDEADVTDLRLEVIEQEFIPVEDPDQEGLYTTSIDFDDRTLFAMPPSAAEIRITAKSSRTPVTPTRSAEATIAIDAEGPTIVVGSPPNLSIVRGQVQLVVGISDPSGVQPGSVIGSINNNQYMLDNWEVNPAGTVYSEQFDTRAAMFSTITQLIINIQADDTVGNQGTVSHVLRLDNVPPILSLDPPPVREYFVNSSSQAICSNHFDPLGEATNDLEVVQASSLYRVMVFERTNVSPDQNYFYHAGVNPATMRLYAQANEAIPLLIDTNDDGTCDNINFETLAPGSRPVELVLSPLTDRGSAHYSPTPEFDAAAHVAAEGCVAGGSNAPGPLCGATSMTRAIPQPLDGSPPAIYAFAPTNGSQGPCEGATYELLPSLGEGWACLAARVSDTIDNVGVSPPIRICVNDGVDPPPGCAVDQTANPPPNCADSCVWPPEFDEHMMLLRR